MFSPFVLLNMTHGASPTFSGPVLTVRVDDKRTWANPTQLTTRPLFCLILPPKSWMKMKSISCLAANALSQVWQFHLFPSFMAFNIILDMNNSYCQTCFYHHTTTTITTYMVLLFELHQHDGFVATLQHLIMIPPRGQFQPVLFSSSRRTPLQSKVLKSPKKILGHSGAWSWCSGISGSDVHKIVTRKN